MADIVLQFETLLGSSDLKTRHKVLDILRSEFISFHLIHSLWVYKACQSLVVKIVWRVIGSIYFIYLHYL